MHDRWENLPSRGARSRSLRRRMVCPLFVEELTKAILESGQLTAVDGHYELTGSFSTLAIPATLQDSLMARLDRLVTAKAVAQYAAVIGRQFAYDLLRRSHNWTTPPYSGSWDGWSRRRLCTNAVCHHKRPIPLSMPSFRMLRMQSLLKSTRQHYHQRIAQVLEAQFPETAEAQPELLAHHYTEAGLTSRLSSIGIKLDKEPSSAQPMWKPALTFAKGWSAQDVARDTRGRPARTGLADHLGPCCVPRKAMLRQRWKDLYPSACTFVNSWETHPSFPRPLGAGDVLCMHGPSCRRPRCWVKQLLTLVQQSPGRCHARSGGSGCLGVYVPVHGSARPAPYPLGTGHQHSMTLISHRSLLRSSMGRTLAWPVEA